MCGNTQIKPSDINTLFNVLETKDSASKKSGLDLQFEVCYIIFMIGRFFICNYAGPGTSVP